MASQSPNAPREEVFCHECQNNWYRDVSGIVCPACGSDFVEIIEVPESEYLRAAEDHGEEFGHARTHRGPGFTFYSQTHHHYPHTHSTQHQHGPRGHHSPEEEVIADMFSQMLRNIMGADYQPGTNRARSPPSMRAERRGDADGDEPMEDRPGTGDHRPFPANPFASAGFGPQFGPRNANQAQAGAGAEQVVPDITTFLHALFNPIGDAEDIPMFARIFGGGAGGDYVYSQAELDRIVSQLMEQHQGNAPPPAAEEDIKALPRIKVTEAMVQEGLDCTVCKEDLVLDEELVQLPCKHNYHFDCVAEWLKAHDTCPICRHPITPEERRNQSSSSQASSSSRPTQSSPTQSTQPGQSQSQSQSQSTSTSNFSTNSQPGTFVNYLFGSIGTAAGGMTHRQSTSFSSSSSHRHNRVEIDEDDDDIPDLESMNSGGNSGNSGSTGNTGNGNAGTGNTSGNTGSTGSANETTRSQQHTTSHFANLFRRH